MTARKIRVSCGPGVFKLFLQIPEDCDDVATVLRLIRDVSPRMPLTKEDNRVMKMMEKSWINIERAALASFYDVDPYELARRPQSDDRERTKKR